MSLRYPESFSMAGPIGVSQRRMLPSAWAFRFLAISSMVLLGPDTSRGQTTAPSVRIHEPWERFPVDVTDEQGRTSRTNMLQLATSSAGIGPRVRGVIEQATRGIPEADMALFFQAMNQVNVAIFLKTSSFTVDVQPQEPLAFDLRHPDLLDAQIELARRHVAGRIEYARRAPPSTPAEQTELEAQVERVCTELVAINVRSREPDRPAEFIRTLAKHLSGPERIGACFRPISQEALDALIRDLRTLAPPPDPSDGQMPGTWIPGTWKAQTEQVKKVWKAFEHYPSHMTADDIRKLEEFQKASREVFARVRVLQREYYGDPITTNPSSPASRPGS